MYSPPSLLRHLARPGFCAAAVRLPSRAVAALTFGRVRRAVQDLSAGVTTRFGMAALATLLAFSYLVFFGQSKGETARLWLFMVPIFCALSADEIRVRSRASAPAVTAVVLLLQWLTVSLTKTGQDFF